jgi:citrate synthase
VDHGLSAPSTAVARTVASCGSPVQAAIAAGITSLGEHHGGAGEACARLLQETLLQGEGQELPELAAGIVRQYRWEGRRLPGFGHRLHNPDPRTVRLFALAKEKDLWGKHLQLLIAIQEARNAETGKQLPINVDGAIAGILSELGLDWRVGKSLFIIARSAGLAAHVHEQMGSKPLDFAPPV